MLKRTVLALLVLALRPPGLAAQEWKVAIREWDVPTANSRPHDPEVAPDGSLFISDWVLSDYHLHGRGVGQRLVGVPHGIA